MVALRKLLVLSVAALALFLPAGHAAALVINFTAGGGILGNADALAALERAAARFERTFKDPVTVTINVDFIEIRDNMNQPEFGVLAQASSVMLSTTYMAFRDAMIADSANETDEKIVSALPTLAQFSAFIPAAPGFSLGNRIALTKANLKALNETNTFGDLDALHGISDAKIEFNTFVPYEFDQATNPDKFDFETIAAHEIGHALGFVSAVDVVDALLDQGMTGEIHASPLDLFRFDTQNPSTMAEFSTFVRDLTPGGSDFLDDLLNERALSTGEAGGDGRQASHWKDDDLTGTTLGLMDPTFAKGEFQHLTSADLRAFDLIGWDIPEPGMLLLFCVGLAGIGIAARRKRIAARAVRDP